MDNTIQDQGAGIAHEDILAEMQRRKEEMSSRVQQLTTVLLDKRKRAIDYRNQLGIEDEWVRCEESYEGIDDANRAYEQPVMARMNKPTTSSGGTTFNASKTSLTRSVAFLNITRPYVDAASARVADMLFPTDDRNFALRPGGIEQLEQLLDKQVVINQQGQTVGQLAQAKLDEVKQRADSAQAQIDEWLIACQFHGEGRKLIEDGARMGTGVLKGPIPISRKRIKASMAQDNKSMTVVAMQEISPNTVCVSPWDCFPDPACGEYVQNGSYFYERDRLSAKQLRELKGQPGYLDDQIALVIQEGPNKTNVINDVRHTLDDDRYEVWYFYGQIAGEDMKSLYGNTDTQYQDFLDVVATIVNGRIIKIAQSHLESGEIPFDFFVWQRRVGMPWGIGVAKQIDIPQRMVNSATRNMNDNASLASGPQIIVLKGVVTPMDKVWEITPRKIWEADPAVVDLVDVEKAFMSVEFPINQQQLLNIVEFALKMAEQTTGIAMLLQGMTGPGTPDTYGGQVLATNNSNIVLRRIARIYDDRITEPHMRRYYEWIMMYGDESVKGDFEVDARGSGYLVDLDIQKRAIMGMANIVANPAFGLSAKRWGVEYLKMNKIDPSRIEMTAKEQQLAEQQMQQQATIAQAQLERRFQSAESIADANNATKEKIADETNKTTLLAKGAQHAVDILVADAQLSGMPGANTPTKPTAPAPAVNGAVQGQPMPQVVNG